MLNKVHIGLLFVISLIFCSCFQLFEPGPATFVKKTYNPSKTKQAILFIKGGNATESDSWQVSIKNADDELDKTEAGNTFTTDGDHGKIVPDSTSISFTWKTDHSLLITYDKRLRTFTQVTNIDGVSVSYTAK